MKCIDFVAASAMLASLAGCASTPLFDAMPYGDWRTLGATPRFEFTTADGHATLTGRGPIPSNGFLASPREVGDFRLAVDVRIGSTDNPLGEKMNSGIQIRSREMNGTVGGLQIEIDPSPRAWSGGVYDERGRAWLAPLEGNDAARAAFRLGEWNRYEIECIGPRVRTRVNGVDCAEWYDEIVSGLIAFQVHGGPPCEVGFRDADFTELGAHAWVAAPEGPMASSGERCAWACGLDAATTGVRMGVVPPARIEVRDGGGALLLEVPVDGVEKDGKDGPASSRRVALVWLDGAGAVLVDGRKVASIARAGEFAAVRVLGAECEVSAAEVLKRR